MINVCIFSFTDTGRKLAERIGKRNDLVFRNEKISFFIEKRTDILKEDFLRYDGIIFIGAAGIAVRKIAPFVNSKLTDPAVIVIDEMCRYVIPILSGHIGGANGISDAISESFGAVSVITTATDVNGLRAIDEILPKKDFTFENPEFIKNINSKMLRGEIIKVYCSENIEPEFPKESIFKASSYKEADVVISSDKNNNFDEKCYVFYKRIVLGVGCRKDTLPDVFESVVENALSEAGVTTNDVKIIASVDLKKDENAILEYVKKNGIEFRTFSASELSEIQGDFDESDFVKEITGVSNVSERSAAACSEAGRFLIKRKAESGVTVSVFEEIKRINFNGKA